MLRNWSLPVVLLSLAAMPAPAQAPETGSLAGLLPPPEPNRVVLDVTVTGEDGSPLPGLTAEDFEVYDDGEPIPGPRIAAPEPTHLVVLLDEARLAPIHRSAVFAELRRQLETLTSTADRILVARQNEEIRIEQELTSDRALVASALDRLEKTPTNVGSEGSARRALLEEIRFGSAPSEQAVGPTRQTDPDDPRLSAESAGATSLAAVRQFAGQERTRSLRTLASLSDLTAALAELPGRKAILLLSGGIDLHPGEALFQAWIDRYRSVTAATGAGSVALEMPTYQTGRELQELLADAGADRVAFYTLDPSGGEALAPSGERRPRGTSALTSRTTVEESLRRLAEETGGAFSPLPDGLGRLAERIGADFRLSYRLEFESSHGGDGAQHNLEVRVRRPGARVRHAARYRDETPDQRLRERAASALLLGVAANPLDVQAELGPPASERGATTVPVKVKIPLARLSLLPHGDSHQGQLSILLLLQDREGNLAAAPKLAVPLQIPNQQLVESMARIGTFDTSVRLRGGEQRIAVAVRDEVGGVDAALALPLGTTAPAGKARGRRR